MEDLNAVIDSMAITEFNIHGGDLSEKKQTYQIQVPQYYAHVRELKQNKLKLRETAKDMQIMKNILISEDLLIRSNKEI